MDPSASASAQAQHPPPPPPPPPAPLPPPAHHDPGQTASASTSTSHGTSSIQPPTAGSSSAAAASTAIAEPSGKPKRIQNVSCDACRARKVKCDRAPKITAWRLANQHIPEASDPGYRPGTDIVWCSHCSEHGIRCTLTIKPPKRRVGRRLTALKANDAAAASATADAADDDNSSGSEFNNEDPPAPAPAPTAGNKRKRSVRQYDPGAGLDAMMEPDLSIGRPSAYASVHQHASPSENAYPDHTARPAFSSAHTPSLSKASKEQSSPPAQTGLFGVPRLTKTVLDACIVGFFSGPCVCPSIVRYEEALPRYRAYFRQRKTSDSCRAGTTPAAADPGLSREDDNMPEPNALQIESNERQPLFRHDELQPMPEILIVALALSGCGQLDKELFPYKLHLQRDLARAWKRIAHEYLHTVDLGMDFAHLGAEARDVPEAHDALDALIIVGAQDFEFLQSEHETAALTAAHTTTRTWALPEALQARRSLRAEHVPYQRALLFQLRGTALEGTLRFAYNMGINRNPLHALTRPPQPPPPSSSSAPAATAEGRRPPPAAPPAAETMSLLTRIRRTREWWSLFASDAFQSLATRRPLLIGDHDFDVPLPSFRFGPAGEGRILSGFGSVGLAKLPASGSGSGSEGKDRTKKTPDGGRDAAATGSALPVHRSGTFLPTSFDLAFMNTIFSLAFLTRGLSRRFVSVRVQGQGVNVLDALNSIELLERFYRGIPDALRWETQDARLLGILAELYPPEASARVAAAATAARRRRSGQGAEEDGSAAPNTVVGNGFSTGHIPATGASESRSAAADAAGSSYPARASAAGGSDSGSVRRRRVPNSLRVTSKAFRDGIQSLFLESLLISVVLCIGSAVRDFGFRTVPAPTLATGQYGPDTTRTGPGAGASDPLSVVEAMLSGQLRENPFYRVDPESSASEPRFLQTLKDDVAAAAAATATGGGGGGGGGSNDEHTAGDEPHAARSAAATAAPVMDVRALAAQQQQQRTMEEVTVSRLYTLMLRFFFRAAKVYREGAQHGFLGARHNTFGSVAAVFGLWGVEHVNSLMRADEAAAASKQKERQARAKERKNEGDPASEPAGSADAHAQRPPAHDPLRRRGMAEYPDACRTAAADTGTNADDAKQAVRDLLEAVASTMDADTRAEALVHALRTAIQPWDEAEVRELLERQQTRHADAVAAAAAAAAVGEGETGAAAAELEAPPSFEPPPAPYDGPRVGLEEEDGGTSSFGFAQQQQQHLQPPRPPPQADSDRAEFYEAAKYTEPPQHSIPSSSAAFRGPAQMGLSLGAVGEAPRPSGSVPLGLDPFADLSQFAVAAAAAASFGDDAAGYNSGGGGGGGSSGAGGGGVGASAFQLPPIGHLAAHYNAAHTLAAAAGGQGLGGTGPGAAGSSSSTAPGGSSDGPAANGNGFPAAATAYDFDRAVREMLAAAAMAQNPLPAPQHLGMGGVGFGHAYAPPPSSSGFGYPMPYNDGGGGGAQQYHQGSQQQQQGQQQQSAAAAAAAAAAALSSFVMPMPALTSEHSSSMDWLASLAGF